jgi:hypothetical protein
MSPRWLKRKDQANDYQEFLRAENRGLCAEEVCYAELKVHEGVCKAKPFSTARVD